MGLPNFPSSSEGVLPVLVMNTVISVAILKKLLKSILQFWNFNNFGEDELELCPTNSPLRRGGISITKFKLMHCEGEEKCSDFTLGELGRESVKCCVCLCKFGEEDEVSELSCKHYFHKKCLDKWFDNHHTTCPLCRSIY